MSDKRKIIMDCDPGTDDTVSTMNWAGDLSMGLSLGSGKKWLPRPSTPWE